MRVEAARLTLRQDRGSSFIPAVGADTHRWCRRLWKYSVLLVLVTIAACTAPGLAGGGPEPQTTVLRVTNQSFDNVTVYVVRSTMRRRLGMVNAISTQSFRIPPDMVLEANTLSFQTDPIGARREPVTQEMLVRAGDQISMTIPP